MKSKIIVLLALLVLLPSQSVIGEQRQSGQKDGRATEIFWQPQPSSNKIHDPHAVRMFESSRSYPICYLNVARLFQDKYYNVSNCAQVHSALRHALLEEAPDPEEVSALRTLATLCGAQASVVCDGVTAGTSSLYSVTDRLGRNRCLAKMPGHVVLKHSTCRLYSDFKDMLLPLGRLVERPDGQREVEQLCNPIQAKPDRPLTDDFDLNQLHISQHFPPEFAETRDYYVHEFPDSVCSGAPSFEIEELRKAAADSSECDYLAVGTIGNVKFIDWNRVAELKRMSVAVPPAIKTDGQIAVAHNFVTFKGTSGFEIYKKCGDARPIPVLMTVAMRSQDGSVINDPNFIQGYGMSSYRVFEEFFSR